MATDEEIRAEASKWAKAKKLFSSNDWVNGAKWHREQSDAKLKELIKNENRILEFAGMIRISELNAIIERNGKAE